MKFFFLFSRIRGFTKRFCLPIGHIFAFVVVNPTTVFFSSQESILCIMYVLLTSLLETIQYYQQLNQLQTLIR